MLLEEARKVDEHAGLVLPLAHDAGALDLVARVEQHRPDGDDLMMGRSGNALDFDRLRNRELGIEHGLDVDDDEGFGHDPIWARADAPSICRKMGLFSYT